MRAVVYNGRHDIEITDRPAPEVRDGQVLRWSGPV